MPRTGRSRPGRRVGPGLIHLPAQPPRAGHGCGSRKELLMSIKGKALAGGGTPTYVTRFDGVRVPATE